MFSDLFSLPGLNNMLVDQTNGRNSQFEFAKTLDDFMTVQTVYHRNIRLSHDSSISDIVRWSIDTQFITYFFLNFLILSSDV